MPLQVYIKILYKNIGLKPYQLLCLFNSLLLSTPLHQLKDTDMKRSKKRKEKAAKLLVDLTQIITLLGKLPPLLIAAKALLSFFMES
jgi:hypothetical protein